MEMVLYTVIAVVLYLVSDQILVYIERFNGGVLPYRSVVFFVIIMTLALVVFDIMEGVMMPDGGPQLPDGSFPTPTNPPTPR